MLRISSLEMYPSKNQRCFQSPKIYVLNTLRYHWKTLPSALKMSRCPLKTIGWWEIHIKTHQKGASIKAKGSLHMNIICYCMKHQNVYNFDWEDCIDWEDSNETVSDKSQNLEAKNKLVTTYALFSEWKRNHIVPELKKIVWVCQLLLWQIFVGDLNQIKVWRNLLHILHLEAGNNVWRKPTTKSSVFT